MSNETTFDEWVEEGYIRGWIGAPVCNTHDGTPISEEELAEFDEGGDPCVHVLRLYESPEQKEQVECAHSPSLWRAANRGLGLDAS
jgi:hypothetical protein